MRLGIVQALKSLHNLQSCSFLQPPLCIELTAGTDDDRMILALTVRGVQKKDHLSTLAWQNQSISSNLAIAGNWRQNSLLRRVWLCAGFAFCKRVLGLQGLTSWITEHPDEAFSFIFLCLSLVSFIFR